MGQHFEQRIAALEARIKQISSNSSRLPSTEPTGRSRQPCVALLRTRSQPPTSPSSSISRLTSSPTRRPVSILEIGKAHRPPEGQPGRGGGDVDRAGVLDLHPVQR